MLIHGVIRSIIFHNESNGYTVARLYAEEEDEEITIVGTSLTIEVGKELELEGEWVFHPKYQEQFSFTSYKEHLPTTKEGIVRYLSSGMIPYVGKKMAKRLVDKFGDKTLDIMESNPNRLLEIEGIGEKKLKKIKEAFEEQQEVRDILLFTQSYGISTNLAVKIYRKFGEASMEIMKQNPYRLAEEVRGIGFNTADQIARNLGFSPDNPLRKRGAISYVMQGSIQQGHCYYPLKLVEEKVSKLLNIPREEVEFSPMELAVHPNFYVAKNEEELCLYYVGMYRWENFVAQDIFRRLRKNFTLEGEKGDIDSLLKNFEIDLAKKQKEALWRALESSIMILTGGPGTGKTTTLRAILLLLESMGKKVTLAAPTGRAAKRMEEATNRKAYTIHRLLAAEYSEDQLFSNMDFDEEIETDVLIIDEVSMVDLPLMYRTLKALPVDARLILVGDKDQLPSVGPGNVLRDLILSQYIPVVELDEIFRQEKDSQIVNNAHMINHGKYPKVNAPGGDFYFIHQSKEKTVEEIISLVKQRLPDFYNINNMDDIQVLTPMRKGVVGVEYLNEKLQAVLNPPNKNKGEATVLGTTFRVGDKVMQIKNNYQLSWKTTSQTYQEEGEGIFNGDTGIVTSIDEEEKMVTITYDDVREVEYSYQMLEEVHLCYATTIHKSQGSEFPVVIIPIQWAPPMLLTRNLLYTGITRARRLVVLVGHESYLKAMIDNDFINIRFTSLERKLRECFQGVEDERSL
ncbi:MAG: ATP-dependent RecD-like DNA helicase [Tissierellia bacterium]|nr:ATP-dependent RecD-like DNA helicase [Tissierellia bacterium]